MNYDLESPEIAQPAIIEQIGGVQQQATAASSTQATGSVLSVALGGTGAGTAVGARSNLGAASSGSNADITALTALTLAVIDGLRIQGYTETAADPTTVEYPTTKDCGIHKNTATGTVFLVFNDGGTIKKRELV